ncbi:MAG: hypothetical protein Q4A17_12860 [Thermoguttaceae bacterium]|nr:hypothetical protein [Thermoguttaceae bacterium]MDO4858822.1 hypothetical protein [Thermoguttaceae bacterium]
MQAPIAVFFALEAESGCFEDRLKHAEHLHAAAFKTVSGTLHDVDFLVVQTGTGMKNALEVTRTVCQAHSPRMLISAGFAGALTGKLKKADLVFPSEILRWDQPLLTIQANLKPESLPENSHLGGRLLTVDQVAAEPKTKRELGVKFQSQAVEMESYAIAQTAQEMNLPFLSIRVISDSVDEILPRDVQKLAEQKTTASRLGAALGMILGRPSSVKELWGLYQDSVNASARLADALESLAKANLFRFCSENFAVPQGERKLISAGD